MEPLGNQTIQRYRKLSPIPLNPESTKKPWGIKKFWYNLKDLFEFLVLKDYIRWRKDKEDPVEEEASETKKEKKAVPWEAPGYAGYLKIW